MGVELRLLPGVSPRLRTDGLAETFEEARLEFEATWSKYLLRCTDADFDEYRSQRALPPGNTPCGKRAAKCRLDCERHDKVLLRCNDKH